MSKRFITFETVSEPVEPDMEQWAAKAPFARIVEALKKQGVEAIEPPQKWDSYGWYSDFDFRSANLSVMLQRSDSWLLLTSTNVGFMDRLKGRRYETELNELARHCLTAIETTLGASAKLYESEAEFIAG